MFMNKKVLTLCAGLLLAGSVYAGNYNSYVIPNTPDFAAEVSAVNGHDAYHLAADGKLLAMQRDANGVMTLALVNAQDADLMETLWTVSIQDDSEGGVSYIFYNKAYGMPLAFDSSKADYKKGTSAVVATGDVNEWKWRSGAAVKGAVEMYSNFHPDSALVLTTNGNRVVAQKIYTKSEKPSNKTRLKIGAFEAQPVYLGVEALNSMLGVQDPEKGQLQMAFEREVLNSEIGNLLTKNKYTAVPANFAISTSMEDHYSPKEGITELENIALGAVSVVINPNSHAGIIQNTDLVENAALAEVKASSLQDLTKDEISTAITDAIDETTTIATAIAAVNSVNTKYANQSDAATAINTAVQAFKASTGAYDANAFNELAVGGLTYPKLETPLFSIEKNYNQVSADKINDLIKATEEGYNFAASQTTLNAKASAYADVLANVASQYEKVSGNYITWQRFNIIFNGIAKPSALSEEEFNAFKALFVAVESNDVKLDEDLASYQDDIVSDLNSIAKYLSDAAANIQAMETPVIGQTKKADFLTAYDAIEVSTEEGTAVKESIKKTFESQDENSFDLTSAQSRISYMTSVYNDNAKVVADAYAAVVDFDSAETVVAALNEIKSNNVNFTDEQTAIIDAVIKVAVGETAEEAVNNALNYLVSNYWNVYTPADLEWVSLRATEAAKPEDNTYLMVDTTFLTSVSGDKHLAFAVKKYKALDKTSFGTSVYPDVKSDFNGRYNFKFTYFPTQDSLDIKVDGYAQQPEKQELGKYYTDLTDVEINTSRDKDGKTVKLAILADNHFEVTVGHPEDRRGTGELTINTRIYLDAAANMVRTTLPSGVYHFNLATNVTDRKADNGKYKVAVYCGETTAYEAIEETQKFGPAQDFNHIPRTQWVVEQNEGVPGEQTVTITNREFPNIQYHNVQLYKAGDNVFANFGAFANDTLSYKVIDKKYTSDPYLGYKHLDNAGDYEKFYALDYLSGIELGNYVNVKADSSVYVDLQDGQSYIEFVKASEDTEYGYASEKAGAVQLKRQAYNLRLSNTALLTESDLYIVKSKDGKSFVASSASGNIDPVEFILKENNQLTAEDGTATCYYALQAVYTEKGKDDKTYVYNDAYGQRVGVRDASMSFSTEDACYYSEEVRVATFAVVEDTTPLYRRLGETLPEDGFEDMTVQNAKIYTINSAEKEYLYEDANSKYSEDLGINFLGVESKGVNAKAAMFVDTAYVRNNTPMPQYMLVMNPQIVEADTIWCNATSTHKHATLADSLACPHTTVIPYSVTGRYLINAQDSVNAGDDNYIWNRDYTRLAFVEAKHIGDTLVIFRNGEPSTAKADSIYLGDNKHKNVAFSFRLVNTDACDFLIETVGDKIIPTDGKGGWVAVKNGVPVVAKYDSYNDAINDAEIFNIESTEETATANESIVAGEVSVVAADGAVIVKGAEGKNVVVSTILGKVVANEVLNSDNETIAAPAGIVVVSVDGESFKVAVK